MQLLTLFNRIANINVTQLKITSMSIVIVRRFAHIFYWQDSLKIGLSNMDVNGNEMHCILFKKITIASMNLG